MDKIERAKVLLNRAFSIEPLTKAEARELDELWLSLNIDDY